MVRRQQPWFDILVAHWRQITPHHFELSILADIIYCHFEHSEMQICDWTERATGDEDDGSLGGILLLLAKTVGGEEVGAQGWFRGGGRHCWG